MLKNLREKTRFEQVVVRKVLVAAHELAQQFRPDHSTKFRRKDFTLPQLFACLVMREHQKKSDRGVEALLEDCPDWRADIGLKRTPDHNTLCRAFQHLIKPGRLNRLLDLMVAWGKRRGLIRGRIKPVALVMALYRHHTGDQAVSVAKAPEGLDVTASCSNDRLFLHVINTNRDRSITTRLAVEGMSIRTGRVFQLAADPQFEVIETQAREIVPVQKDLPPDGLWTFPPASVSAVELDAERAGVHYG
jgi:hypothetical protein